MEFPIAITFGQEENDLLSREVFFLKSGLSSVNVVDHVAFPELPFERLDHFGFDRPVLVTTNAVRDFSLLDTNVSDNSNLFVIAAKIAERRPLLVLLAQRKSRKNQENEEGCQK
jgi:hypothetical protein